MGTTLLNNITKNKACLNLRTSRMKQIHSLLLSLVMLTFDGCIHIQANDCIYTVSGNHLMPLCDTDVSVSKEILAIGLNDDGFAYVDVYYEMQNDGQEKNLTVGFEAQPLNYDVSHYSPMTGDPYIEDFSVVMNEAELPYAINISKGQNFNPDAETVWDYSYVYAFDAKFKHGKNTIRHRYRYQISKSIENVFDIAYKLTPATRWANGKIDDFTLMLRADNTAKHFFIPDSVFRGADFEINEGEGRIRKNQSGEYGSITEVIVRNGSVCWRMNDFRPDGELSILSADRLVTPVYDKQYVLGTYYDRSENFLQTLKTWQECTHNDIDEAIWRNLPYASRGHVFKNLRLKRFFESQWWYMPNSNYKSNTDDFTPYEREMLNLLNKK